MIEKQVTIINKLGLHARATAKLIGVTSNYASTIKLIKDGRSVDAKSIMSVMMLAASKGTELTLVVEGEDEDEAAAAVEALINNYFGEGE
ncbi:HPr family phosphocarrier protein [Motiliproteus sp. SC1-56]|uniref:HPr family phosphocarrier protein n=1 Tax=Motiliproteus sp. SC1-56 TaxID=2799565 RepID=UPI001A90BACE|nr:HPr family phosphocarrier protein [Motiliproteus sp. SC1-56]